MTGAAALVPPAGTIGHYLLILFTAAALGAALGVLRPHRRDIQPRDTHIIHAQILLAIVGAIIIVVVAESLARAFAIVGAAGLVRYRARISDPKDAGVMLVALAVGLTTGSGMFGFALLACAFILALLWVLESFEPAARTRFQLIVGTHEPARMRPEVEHVLQNRGVSYVLLGVTPRELRYEVTVPFKAKIRKLTKMITGLDKGDRTTVQWDVRTVEALRP